jgi:hypothetical protein
MGINFPDTPVNGLVFDPATGVVYQWDGVAWNIVTNTQSLATAETRNRIVNPAMMHSQENGDTAGSVSQYYPADQWLSVMAGITSFSTARQLASYNQIYMQGVKATLAAGDYAFFQQSIEGLQTTDFLWGSPQAAPAVLRFDAYSQFGGTFAISIRNGNAPDRSFIAPFTVPVQVWTTIEIPIPGDTTGTWATSNAVCITAAITYACGSTFAGVTGWQAGNKLGLPTMSNGFATLGSNYIRNVGFYRDPNGTGKAPPFQMPNYADELARCRRYWQRLLSQVVDNNAVSQSTTFQASMRAGPTISGGGAGFAMAGLTTDSAQFYQTTRAYQNLTLNARM